MLGLLNFMEQGEVDAFTLILLAVLFYGATAGKTMASFGPTGQGLFFPIKKNYLRCSMESSIIK